MINKKGFSRILEAILALTLIVMPITLLYNQQKISTINESQLKDILIKSIIEADQNGELKEAIYNNEWNKVKTLILNSIPAEINITIEILDENQKLIAKINRGILNQNNSIVIAKYTLTFRRMKRIVIIKGST